MKFFFRNCYVKVRNAFRTIGVYVDFFSFRKLPGANRLPLRFSDLKPCVLDRTKKTGFDRHYIYHTAWAARVLAELKPAHHVDISSTLYFSTIVSAFTSVTFYDYRPADLRLDGLQTGSADLTRLPFADNSQKSLSCLHTLEHVGLGRYGDPLDPNGDLKAMRELARVLAPGGDLLIVVPIGKPRIVFNAHRIYSYAQIIDAFPTLTVKEFALIPDHAEDGGLIRHADPNLADRQTYGCGCFWMKKDRIK